MKATINRHKTMFHKVEAALHEFYSRSIYKRMVDDVSRQLKYKGNVPEKKFKENTAQNMVARKHNISKDIDNDLPGMLFI
jgi:hypothetical protein